MSMPTSEQVRCTQCGSEIDSRFHFCGMCGSKLPTPLSNENAEMRSAEIPEPTRVVSGPSFLGLADDPADGGAYLLEDEASRPSRARLVVAVILVTALAAAAWHWRGDLKQWATQFIQKPANPQTQTNVSYQVAPISTSGSEVAGSLPTAQSMTETPATAAPQIPSPPQPAPPVAQGDNSASAIAATNSAQPPASGAGPLSSQANAAEAAPNTMSDQQPAKQSAEKETAQPVPAAETTGEDLEAEGEKYLYGSSVPVNCSRAQKDLLTAADQESSKAASVLGTMYATGHCVPRDLSLAYVWFAKAMRLEPDNSRFEDDLMVVWNQMTPDERQIAIHRKP